MNEPQSSDTKVGEGEPGEEAPANHWHLLRDVLAFQVKLALDGIRDLLLSPLSIIAVLAGVIASPRKPDRYFRRLMHL
ncbi:MAG: hypothetical protein KDI19_10210, partial [Pseudomonadales bacterium]|nr:hypothetical protein [Pseudomonadales bacterium]